MSTRLTVKSSDRKSVLVKEQASSPYESTGMHLLAIIWRMTSSEAKFNSLPKIPFTALQNERRSTFEMSQTDNKDPQISDLADPRNSTTFTS